VDDAKHDARVEAPPATTGASLGIDVHRAKMSPDDPRVQISRPRARTLKRGPVLIAVVAVVAVITIALVVALAGPSSEAVTAKKDDPGAGAPPAGAVPLPDVITNAPTHRGTPSRTPRRLAAGTTAPLAEPSDDRGAAGRRRSWRAPARRASSRASKTRRRSRPLPARAPADPPRPGAPPRSIGPPTRTRKRAGTTSSSARASPTPSSWTDRCRPLAAPSRSKPGP
jgi:hypothetical protein